MDIEPEIIHLHILSQHSEWRNRGIEENWQLSSLIFGANQLVRPKTLKQDEFLPPVINAGFSVINAKQNLNNMEDNIEIEMEI